MTPRFADLVKSAMKTAGFRVLRTAKMPFGIDPMQDLERLFGSHPPSVLFDVGANVGQTSLALSARFPAATVHAFEPVRSTYDRLLANTRGRSSIRPVNAALGAEADHVRISLTNSAQNSLLRRDTAAEGSGRNEETVVVMTGAEYCDRGRIEVIDLLKSDTEGFDLEVLAGFEPMLRRGAVRYILAECELARVTPEPHTDFFSLHEHLTKRGFAFVTLYTGHATARGFHWGNALFASADEARRAGGAARPQAVGRQDEVGVGA